MVKNITIMQNLVNLFGKNLKNWQILNADKLLVGHHLEAGANLRCKLNLYP